jgi:hypothetical protein
MTNVKSMAARPNGASPNGSGSGTAMGETPMLEGSTEEKSNQ